MKCNEITEKKNSLKPAVYMMRFVVGAVNIKCTLKSSF